ncbi:DUF4328 domain-containing protein [Streptomyces lincolnensis]|uniref:DUF4328 domain-containing protein n=1 Tax=Streptomyces lincolnensis TaxID=1915 RepID=UPI001E4DDD03|nr:DUF4328 domain-containing protein [Streptomyces lincolnensis]
MSASSELRPRPLLPGGVPRFSRLLLAAVTASLAVVVLTDLFAVFAGFRIHRLIDGNHGFVMASQQELDAAYSLYERAGNLQVITFVPCAVLFVVWFFGARRNAGPLGPDRFRNGPGWAIGAWLIPLVNLWMPYRVAIDIWGASAQLPADGEPYRMPIWPVNLWWGLFVSSTLLGRYAGSRYDDADTLAEVRDAVVQYMMTDVLDIAAAVAAVYFAVRLTSMQRLKAAEGPYRTVVPEPPAR